MKQCTYCAESVRDEAIKCRHCGSMIGGSPLSSSWFRSRRGKMIAGVCAGLAEQFGVSVTALRLALILFTLIGGWGVIVYVILWVIMPYQESSGRHDLQVTVPDEVR